MSENSTTTYCPLGEIPALPDIEGIGTRTATYAQLILAIATGALSPSSAAFDAWWTILVTSLGLQFAALAFAKRDELTFFHVLVVCWLAFPVFAMSWFYIFLHWQREAMPPELVLATHLHGLLFTGFGLWVWVTAHTFGPCPELNASTQFVLLGKSIHPLGGLRTVMIILYSIWCFKLTIAFIFALVKLIPAARRNMYNSCRSLNLMFSPEIHFVKAIMPSDSLSLTVITISNLLTVGFSIWTVEDLLKRNMRGQAGAETNEFTFGQIASLILLIGPIFSFGRLVVYLMEKRKGKQKRTSRPFVRTGTMIRALEECEHLEKSPVDEKVQEVDSGDGSERMEVNSLKKTKSEV